MYCTTYEKSPLGRLTLASDGEALVGLWLEEQKYFGGGFSGEMERREDLPVFARTEQWLERYFAGERPSAANLPLAPVGSPFRREVWGMLCQIPYGQTISYGELARRMARLLGRESMSPQAVGGAVGHNPISIIIPCHRVVGADGSLTGYAGGLERKRWLLEHEGVDVSRFTLPKRGTAL